MKANEDINKHLASLPPGFVKKIPGMYASRKRINDPEEWLKATRPINKSEPDLYSCFADKNNQESINIVDPRTSGDALSPDTPKGMY